MGRVPLARAVLNLPPRGLGRRHGSLAAIGLVRFHYLTLAAHGREDAAGFHRLTDTVRHEPCSLERDAQRAVKLVGADALLAGRDQEDRLKPQVHGDVRGLEDGPDLHGEGLPAGVALVGAKARALPLHGAGLIHDAAMRADAALRPDASFNKGIGRARSS